MSYTDIHEPLRFDGIHVAVLTGDNGHGKSALFDAIMFNLTGLVAKLRGAPDAEALIVEVVEAMTTNRTFFFRDKVPFERFRDTIMPALFVGARARAAASASGAPPQRRGRSPIRSPSR